MANALTVHLQKILPQHWLSRMMGKLGSTRTPWIKNWMINRFIHTYQVDMAIARLEHPDDYPDFNHFFIRQLKSDARSIAQDANAIASPVDGLIAQIGTVRNNTLLQAKSFYYTLESLLGDKVLAETFNDGSYATLYLAPRDYHRVHMPLSGKLVQSRYIPGKLFSVNRMTSDLIPNLFTRNERLVLEFETEAGPMAVILVGAMIVGNIQTMWMDKPVRSAHPVTTTPANIHLQKGQELGHFTLGSTVILLFGKDKIHWEQTCKADKTVVLGEALGQIANS